MQILVGGCCSSLSLSLSLLSQRLPSAELHTFKCHAEFEDHITLNTVAILLLLHQVHIIENMDSRNMIQKLL
jgi:hypothetical protein